MIFITNKSICIFLTISFACFVLVGNARASLVSVSSDMALLELRFSSSEPLAELFWTDEWFGTVTAHAHDSDSASDDDFDDLLADNGAILAEAHTAHVNSLATYEVINGDLVAIDPTGQVSASTHSDLLLTDPFKFADGFSLADFDNYFLIFGGTLGDTVEVTFELDFIGQLWAEADAEGFFEMELAALLELQDLFGNVLDDDLIFDFQFGTNTTFHQDYVGTLSVTADLLYGEEYWLFAGADSEIYGVTVPEPATSMLLCFGLGLLGWRSKTNNTLKP